MINTTMNALRLNKVNELEYCTLPVPQAEEYGVVSKVEAVSICGTDPHIINGEFPNFWPKEFPIVLGHEWSGIITQLGEKTADFGWQIGDRVCGTSHVGCGHCLMCLKGRYNLCLNYGKAEIGHRQYGHYSQGAYAQYMSSSIKAIARIPDDMAYNVAACMDPLSIALHMVNRSNLVQGDTVLINGSGAQGLLSILCARSRGAGKIIVSGSGSRLKAAQELGAITIDYRQADVVKQVREMTGGNGVERVIECSGTEGGIITACEAVAKGGCISSVSLPSESIKMPIRKLVLEEIEFVGNRANPNTVQGAIEIGMKYHREIERLITHIFPLAEYEKAFAIFNTRAENSIKIILIP